MTEVQILKMSFKGSCLKKFLSEKSKATYLTFYVDAKGPDGVDSVELGLRVPEGKRFAIPMREEHSWEVDLTPTSYGKNQVLDIQDIRIVA